NSHRLDVTCGSGVGAEVMTRLTAEEALASEAAEQVRQRPFIDIDCLVMKYGDRLAVNELDFQVVRGEFISVIGPSGCGKSSMLQALSGLQAPTGGSIRLDGESIHDGLASKTSVGYVFQDH